MRHRYLCKLFALIKEHAVEDGYNPGLPVLRNLREGALEALRAMHFDRLNR